MSALKEKAREERRIARSRSKAKKVKKATEPLEKSSGNVWINLRAPTPGPTPALIERKAPVVGADGHELPEEVERSFFQRYWWIFLIGALFALQSGGGEK